MVGAILSAWYPKPLDSDSRPTLARSRGERAPPNIALTEAAALAVEEPRPKPKGGLLEGQRETNEVDSIELYSSNGGKACAIVERIFGQLLRRAEGAGDFGNGAPG